MSMKEKIMPPLVLTLICVITSALLVAAYNITYVDTTGVITDELASGLTEIYGGSDGFDMLTELSRPMTALPRSSQTAAALPLR